MKKIRKEKDSGLTCPWVPSLCRELRELVNVCCSFNSHNSVRYKPKWKHNYNSYRTEIWAKDSVPQFWVAELELESRSAWLQSSFYAAVDKKAQQ